MGFNEMTHAFIAAKYYVHMTEAFGERGKAAFIHGTQYYGSQRGRRMAQSVGLDYGSKYFSITVTNSIPTENTDFKVKKNARALDRNHGHGMHKMIGICEKYNGEFNQTLKDGKMITTAYLPC